MRGKTMKVSRILLYYSLAVTVCLFLIFIIFIRTVSVPQSNLPNYLYVINDKNIPFSIQSGNSGMYLDVSSLSPINKTSLEDYYIGALYKNIPYLIVCLMGMIVIGTVALYKILKIQHEKKALLLAKQLNNIDEETSIMEQYQHPAIAQAYCNIKERFEAYALDYVRLSSYVTH
ncbi:hypothetical protein B1222_02050 [Paenibacillus larvae subsp. pulvifaciens]|nr:hypothetical protein [Paenibacillus larvae]AQT83492.1 hypothetical protein B1222_02050 [Paenibacillus larvae subsp. pulvifaciens]AQZ48594.1 hypothetical protein B5S25_20475 [Paenibacillus larvae subsp. pulvifaciens]MBH0342146.1 hypothetical protein [Paenibacillus larvae]MCY7519045.1 hypothetical protein [Paenibacillus larvae]MCY9503091.1 hypothetical protein [Paenibacillus larvae]